jgi:hypothetical protein
VTLRGDGPGATILKVYSSVDYATPTELGSFTGGGWTVPSTTLDIAAGSAGNRDTAGVTLTFGRSTVRYTRTIATGMKIQVLKDGVVVGGDDNGPVSSFAEREITFTTSADPGSHTLKFRLVDPGGHSGNAAQISDVRVFNALDSSPAEDTGSHHVARKYLESSRRQTARKTAMKSAPGRMALLLPFCHLRRDVGFNQ